MTTSITEESETAQITNATSTKPSKKPHPGARRAHVASPKAKAGTKPGSVKKASKTARKPSHNREGKQDRTGH